MKIRNNIGEITKFEFMGVIVKFNKCWEFCIHRNGGENFAP